jgi:superfamily I DNA/RNA helicase
MEMATVIPNITGAYQTGSGPGGPITITPAQRAAIEAPMGPLLVLAGPGAGKTFCLIERIRFLVAHQQMDPSRIVAVTFTNKAAGEIAQRLRGQLGAGADQVTRSTIHALCVQLLREFGSSIGVPEGFGIADEEYQLQVLRRVNYRYAKGWVLRRFGLHLIQDQPLDDFLTRLYQGYRERLDRHRLLDFDDLVVRTEILLRTRDEVAQAVASRWDYVLVDEAQDLNPKQYAILKYLATPHRNIFMVGDDEQSIYSWAGADPVVLRTFVNDYGLTDRVLLDENRRNARQIFETARRLIAHNPKQHEKQALCATREAPWPVLVQRFSDETEEGRWLIADLARQRAEGVPWGEMALLYRRHDIGETLEAALVEAGIPCQLAQGRAIADDAVVQYLVAALQVIAQPDDPIHAERFARVVLPYPLYARLRSEADRRGVEFRDWLRRLAKSLPNRDEDGRKIRRCLSTLANLPALAERHESLDALVHELLSQRVGAYRGPLDEKYADLLLSDPLADPVADRLSHRLAGALHGRKRVWLPRLGGAELGLSSLLRNAGITIVDYLDPGAAPTPDDIQLSAEERGPYSFPLTVFKALQLLHARELEPAFQDFVAVDIETTDLEVESCEVVELAAVRVREGKLIDEFHRLVRPTGPVGQGATAVHGYTAHDLAGAPGFDLVWSEFRRFQGGDTLVAHNGHGFDFPVLRRLAAKHPSGNEFPSYDPLPLARDLHPGSRKLGDLARAFGIDPGREHHALDDTRTLARVLLELDKRKLARARTTILGSLIDHLAVAQALLDPAQVGAEDLAFFDVGRLFALGRYTQALADYAGERNHPGAGEAPDMEQLIERLGGRTLMERLQREKRADDRYPAVMARLRRLLDRVSGDTLRDQLAGFLDRVALSQSRGGPEVDRERVNLVTLHSTKGLEFSRVYVVGVEDGQLPGQHQGKEPSRHEVEEGRRLLYVGMTRAKDRLVLTRAARRGGTPTGETRYLDEMDLG